MKEILNKIYYVGVNDRNKNLFEGLWPLPNGVSYNSYLIDDEKLCLVDTVEVDFFVQYLENIREVIAFPMAGSGQDLMCSAPNTVTEQQLREVHIKLR